MEITIEPFERYWYQAWLIVGAVKQEIGRSYFDYDDCRINCEKIVTEFSKQGMNIVHDKIYDEMK